MSSMKRTVELVPPQTDIKRELITSPGHVCGYCHGIGHFEPEWYRPYEESIPCPVCGGSGQVDAIITVEWKPSKSK